LFRRGQRLSGAAFCADFNAMISFRFGWLDLEGSPSGIMGYSSPTTPWRTHVCALEYTRHYSLRARVDLHPSFLERALL